MTVAYPSKKISAENAYRKNKLLIEKTIKIRKEYFKSCTKEK